MNWYSREERALRRVRLVVLGVAQVRPQPPARRHDLQHERARTCRRDTPTVFETLDDAGVRTAGTTYLIFRGRHEHEVSRDFALTRVASQLFQKRSVLGPRELFYADIFASRKTGCWSRMGIPGMRDQHAGCVGCYLVEHDLFDFLLLSLPDNDAHSHKHGPHAQIASIAAADAELWRVMEAGGGVEAFLDEHAMIVMADHSHSHIERVIDLTGAVRRLEGAAAVGRQRDVTPSSRCARRSARR